MKNLSESLGIVREFIDDIDRVNYGRDRGGVEVGPEAGGNAEGEDDEENEEDEENERDFAAIRGSGTGSHGRGREGAGVGVGVGIGSLVESLFMRRRGGHGM